MTVKLPDGLESILLPKFSDGETAQLCADADRDNDAGFRDVCLVATNQGLWVITGEKVRQKAFRGFVNRARLPEFNTTRDFSLYTFDRISLEKIDKLEVIKLVSGGQLTRIRNGQQSAVCSFTNAKAKEIGRFVMLFNRLKTNGELTVEDLRSTEKQETCPKCGMIYPDPSHPVCPRCSKKSTTMVRILKMAKPYKWLMVAVYLMTVLGIGVDLILTMLKSKILYDEVLTSGGEMYGQIGRLILMIVGCMLVQLALRVASNIVNVNFSARLIYSLKTEVFKAMQRLSLSFFMDKQTGTLMTRINSDASGMHYFFVDGLPYIVIGVGKVVVASVIMFILDWKLTLLCYIPVLIIIFYLRRKFDVLGKLNWRRFRRRSSLNSLISDTVKGTRVIKAFGREEAEVDRFGRVNSKFRDIETDFNKQISTLIPINSLVINAGGLLIWAFGGAQIMGGVIQYGSLMAFIHIINLIYEPISSLPDVVNWWANCMTSAQRIFEVLDAPVEVKEPEDPVIRDEMKGDIRLKDVSFGYDINKYVLKNIDFEIKAGTMVGVVGHSGAGKSTLVNLISRFYDVNEGSIEIDGVNVKDYPFRFLRENIGIVSQDIYVFNGTVADNIAYAKPGGSREDIVRAAKIANAHDFIEKLPDGYDTIVGPGGSELSGGEKQRLSIARAIYQDPKVLILDEATASLDTETERLIQEGLEALIVGRTTIAIAHRLSTLRNADYIVVIDKGEIVEQGKHKDLLQSKGEYFRQVQKQTEALKVTGL